MIEIVLELAALGVALFCVVDCLKNRTKLYYPFPKGWIERLRNQHFTYLIMLITLMVSAVSSVFELSLELYAALEDVFLLYLLNEIYFISHCALSFLFSLYIINMTKVVRNKSRSFYVPLCIPFALAELFIITNPLTKLIFYIADDFTYRRGSMVWLIYVVAAFHIGFGLIFFARHKDLISRFERIAMVVLMTIAILGIVLQAVFAVNVELFFEAIGFLGFMLLLEDDMAGAENGENGKMSIRFIIVIALTFFTVIAMNMILIYNAATDQTDRIGETQVNSLKGEMQQALSEAESYILQYSMGLEQLINEGASQDEIESYISSQQAYFTNLSGGNCFGVYAGSPEWTFNPNGVPEGFNAAEREWYIGAREYPGKVFITEPYIDVNNGQLCYTFAYPLSDKKTVAGMDYTLSKAQDIVEKMSTSDDQFALIVTGNGTIVASSLNKDHGMHISDVMPEYSDVFERVKSSSTHRSFTTEIDGTKKLVFASETDNGWRFILVVDHASFYKGTLDQMIMLGTIDILMVAVIVIFYMVSLNNQMKAEKTLSATEDFIASLSDDLRNPLNEILRVSNAYSGQDADEALIRSVRDAGNRLKEKMDNLFLYSDILKAETAEKVSARIKDSGRTAMSGRTIRRVVTGILTAAFLAGFAICLTVAARSGQERIDNEAEIYSEKITTWMKQQQSVLQLLSDVVVEKPEMIDDPDMTFTYSEEPYKREISAPYYDSKTGRYRITFSRSIYASDGRFLGVYATDCLLDRLVDVIKAGGPGDGYLFMVDINGMIIDHPYAMYQLTPEGGVSIEDTGYSDVYHNGRTFLMRDYDGRFVTCKASRCTLSGYTVIVVRNWWSIYGTVLIIIAAFLVMTVLSVIIVNRLINRFIGLQEETNEQLIEAVDSAVAAQKAKSRFLAQMSHEIRTPINAVLGMNEMILRESGDDSIREYAGSIRFAGRNLLGLINSILDFSKIEEGKMEIIPIKYDTASMIGNIINSVSNRAEDKGLVFETHIDSEIPSVLYGDDMRISQVAINLLTNAVKYTKEGRVDLYVAGKPAGDGCISLRMRVKDTGIGIREEDIDKLFESFTRLDEKKNRNIEGTGLGMAIVNGLLDMMGSKLEVKSVYGEGSEFAFEVRQDIVDPEPVGDLRRGVGKAAQQSDDDTYLYAPKARILIVDDNEMNLKVVRNLLKLNGIVPDLALSGAQALELMAERSYDVVLLDHMMPEMDGIETLEKAKEKDLVAKDCAVIALTANAVVGARESYLDAGFDDYLSKPIEIKALEGALAKYLPEDYIEYRKMSEKDVPDTENGTDAKSVTGTQKDWMEVLAVGGFDTETGLKYNGGDRSYYKDILTEYALSADTKIKELDDLLAAGDLKNYGIKVHSLKSLSRTIGAMKVSELAAGLEKASDEGDDEIVKITHPELAVEYKKAVSVIDSSGITEGKNYGDNDNGNDNDDDDEVIMFTAK